MATMQWAIPGLEQPTQRELGEVARPVWVPSVRPTVDLELESAFVRAASAWARWRERQRWQGGGDER